MLFRSQIAVSIVVPSVRTMTICGPVASNVSTDSANTAICDQAHALAIGESLGGNRIAHEFQIMRFVGCVRFSLVGVVVPRCFAYSVRVNETSVDLRHRAALGRREFGCRRDSIREVGMGVTIGWGRRLDVARSPVQLFDRQIQRGGQRLDHRLGGCPQSPFDLREIRIGNSDRLGQLAQGQLRKLALFADDRP